MTPKGETSGSVEAAVPFKCKPASEASGSPQVSSKLSKILESNAKKAYQADLPDPQFRRVAGDVRQRTDRIARAEPPPTNPPRMPLSTQKPRRSSGRRADKINAGDDSESDSDDGHNERNHDDGAPSRSASKRKPTPPGVEPPMQLPPSKFEQEDIERLALFRTLRQVGEHTAMIRKRRIHLRQQMPEIISALVDRAERTYPKRNHSSGVEFSLFYKETTLQNARFREYLDDALYGDIVDKLEADDEERHKSAEQKRNETTNQIVLQVERDLIEQFREFNTLDESGNEDKAMSQAERLNAILTKVLTNLWDHVTKEEAAEAGIGQLAEEFVEKHCPAMDSGGSTVVLLESLVRRITNDLAYSVETALELGKSEPEQESFPLCQLIKESRRNDNLTQWYINWVLSGLSEYQWQDTLADWHRERRAETVREFRTTMASIQMSVTQEFFCDLDSSGKVSLVLFKGDYAATVKEVSPRDLQRIGWTSDSGKHWRNVAGHFPTYIVRVSMDGEVLGIFDNAGRYMSVETPRTRRKSHEARSEIAPSFGNTGGV